MRSINVPPALRHRSFRLLWFGLILSTTGTYMQSAAVLWHIHEHSPEPIALGAVGLVTILPVLVFSLVAGAIADAVNRRHLLILTQFTLALLAALLGWLTLRGADSLPVIYIVIAASAAVSTFDLPAHQALVPNLVPRDTLTNAFSLDSIAYTTGAILGPTLGGLVIASLGVANVYLINALSFTAVIFALLAMGPVNQAAGRSSQEVAMPHASRNHAANFQSAIADGLRFVFRQPIILGCMLLDFFATFFSSATFLLPIFAKEILAVGVRGYGWLVAAPSIGAGIVAGVFSMRKEVKHQGPILLGAVGVFGLATIGFGLARAFWLTFLSLAFTGAADAVSTIIRNTIRQIETPDQLRGRMTSVNQIFFMGGPQLGELEAGLVGQGFGAPFAVVSGGIGCILALGIITLRFPELRRYGSSGTAFDEGYRIAEPE
jgi:MFS family permease